MRNVSALAALAVLAVASPANYATYVQPFVQTNNFSGAVLIERDGRPVFERAFGFADGARALQNTMDTQFHVASVSMQYTAAAVLRLADSGAIDLDAGIGKYLPDMNFPHNITVRDLLEERSCLPDINGFPTYGATLQQHQTPTGLVAQIRGKPLVCSPGGNYTHEEHSAYNVLALLIETVTGQPFPAAMQKVFFEPLSLTTSGADDDTIPQDTNFAHGYQPVGLSDISAAQPIHWSAKAGNGSAYTTAGDEARWVDTLFAGRALSATSTNAILDLQGAGYGWFKKYNAGLGETVYYMNGRAPGYSSFVLHAPKERLTVVVLSNIYSSVTTTIGNNLAALALGKSYEAFNPVLHALTPQQLRASRGSFLFGQDFYQPNARLSLVATNNDLTIVWPDGSLTHLIPVGTDRFIDRSYWENVVIGRDAAGNPATLTYGTYQGKAAK